MKTRSRGPIAEESLVKASPRLKRRQPSSPLTTPTKKRTKEDKEPEINKDDKVQESVVPNKKDPLPPSPQKTVLTPKKAKAKVDPPISESKRSKAPEEEDEPLRLSDAEGENMEEDNMKNCEPEQLEVKPTAVKIKTCVKLSEDPKKSSEHAKDLQEDLVLKHVPQKYIFDDRVKVKPIQLDQSKNICKSGRFWKNSRDPFSSLVTTKGLKSDLKKKNALRMELKKVKALERSIKEEAKMKKQELNERRLENARRREINARKSEIVQTLKNPAKIKKMKKKQLRMIVKRDVTMPEPVAVT
eukprot:TRINITY_DN2106_c0_g1_i2.p1 TRINITY_DN2106_c0_g1~~TRINITY_DN2106_c0_g1_i2.p1  ORF type:complete len:300 (+),score=63.39 TRINITY_DN2106_c0_g1_i2:184-1083(+)